MKIPTDNHNPLGDPHLKPDFQSSHNEQTIVDILSRVHYQEAHRAKSQMPGKFIVFEGLDGAGTTTQAHALVDYLQSQNIESYLLNSTAVDDHQQERYC